MSQSETAPRTPLCFMTDRQLLFLVEDELVPAGKRALAEQLLQERVDAIPNDCLAMLDLAEKLQPYSMKSWAEPWRDQRPGR
jgi:hypothetical protein